MISLHPHWELIRDFRRFGNEENDGQAYSTFFQEIKIILLNRICFIKTLYAH